MTFARGPLFWRAAAWLAFLGPSFFLLYGWANHWTALHAPVPSVVFGWEHRIPFVPEFMLPYMSEDLFYGLSLFIVASRQELTRHGQRLLAATVLSVACFVAYPLQFSFDRPAVQGFNGWLLDLLMGFDKPYNQAPSLHISLLVVLWAHYAKHVSGVAWSLLRVWLVAIGLSVLFVWQHHFIDVILGLFAGFVVLYALPDTPWQRSGHRTPRHTQLGLRYAMLSGLCATLGAGLQGQSWWFLWPATSFALVALAYLGLGSAVFQKSPDGTRAPAATVLLLPYLLLAKLSQHLLSRKLRTTSVGGVQLGPWPPVAPLVVLDLAPELPRAGGVAYCHVPMLDLAVPSVAQLEQAVAALTSLMGQHRNVYVHCALGLERSALVVAAWLVRSGQVPTTALALDALITLHPGVRFSAGAKRCLEDWAALRPEERCNNAAV